VKPWPAHPVVHEVFTWVWLTELTATLGRRVTLADVPADVWDDVARPGIDAVWLMGVWARSPLGAEIARMHPGMRAAHEAALPDLTDADVVGSAYCIRDYVVDEALGGDAGLAVARRELADRGVRLVLDLVPNHVAPDHRWVQEHPEYFVHGTPEDLAREPDGFYAAGDRVIARGRDPYFPAWPEVLQLDASHAGLRDAMTAVLAGIAARCDGVRCDMAMLVLDDVFWRTWGERASGGASPDGGRGFWPTVLAPVRAAHPDFAVWAEAYWDLEAALVEQGFDACYDKRLADRLVHGVPPSEVLAHLRADPAWQQRCIRFVENHDEVRAASVLDPAAHRMALVAVLTLPGIALVHEGGPDGRRVRVPVTLGRRPVEPLDPELRAFADRVLRLLHEGLRQGTWTLHEAAPAAGTPDPCPVLAWSWTDGDRRHLVGVNLADTPATAAVPLGTPAGDATVVDAVDLLTDRPVALAASGEHCELALPGHGAVVLRLGS
jgi:hypothetical protein